MNFETVFEKERGFNHEHGIIDAVCNLRIDGNRHISFFSGCNYPGHQGNAVSRKYSDQCSCSGGGIDPLSSVGRDCLSIF